MSALAPEERDLLAAQHALGVLEGAERAQAEELARTDPVFAQEVEAWQLRLAPLLDDIAPVAPSPLLWSRIAAGLDAPEAAPAASAASNVVALDRRLAIWRGYSAAITGLAAALLLAIGLGLIGPAPQAPPQQQPSAPQPTMVATVASEDRSAAFAVAYDPASSSLLVTPAVATPAPGHDHQLWLIPAAGTPRSLGLVASTQPHRIAVPHELGGHMLPSSTIAISVEPVGGSATGQPTGPVVATGKLSPV